MPGRPSRYCTRPYRSTTQTTSLKKRTIGFGAHARLAEGSTDVPGVYLTARPRAPCKLAVAERAVGDPDRYVDRAVGTQRALCGLVGACYGRTLLGDDDAEPGPGRDGDVEDGDLAA